MRSQLPWIIYGATGTTGRLVVESALAHGHRPILAGRDADRLRALAAPHELEFAAVRLDDRAGLERLLRRSSRVLHTAGPFARTSGPMLDACLATGTPYLDVSGEIDALAATLARSDEARARGIPLIAGAGFGVTAGDSIAAHVARRRPRATHLLIGIDAQSALGSAGAALSRLDVVSGGGAWIENGGVSRGPIAHRRFLAQFDGCSQTFVAAPLAEALAAHRTTGIANVVAGLPTRRWLAPALKWLSPLLRLIAQRHAIRRFVEKRARGRAGAQPASTETPSLRSKVWAEAADDEGRVSAVLEMGEGYAFAAEAIVLAAQALDRRPLAGAFTPAAAFGPDFVLEIRGVERRDSTNVQAR